MVIVKQGVKVVPCKHSLAGKCLLIMTEKRPHTLILFDIDGTLVISADNYGRRMFEEMAVHFFDKTISLEGYSFSGKTDRLIVSEVASIADISDDHLQDHEERILEWIPGRLEEYLGKKQLILLPKVVELLDRLQEQEDTTLALLTGNLPKCAELKLGSVDLMKYFKFGSYGTISRNRNDLGPAALEIFKEMNDSDDLRVVIVGDAVPDVLVAKHIGAKCVITLTGRTSREEVAVHDPEVIFDDLSDTEQVLTAIYS